MTHDPFQTYAMLGAYSGVPTLQPFTQQNYGQYPAGLNPLAQQNPLASILAAQNNPQLQGIGSFHQGGNPGAFQGQPNPFTAFQQNPYQQNPYQQNPYQQNPYQQNPFAMQNPYLAALQNPWIAASLQNPMLNPLLTQTLGLPSPYQQGFYGAGGFGQTGYPLAPQSWIGQGAQTGQIHPLQHSLQHQAAHGFTPGINPWTGY